MSVADGELIFRMPYGLDEAEAETFARQHASWIVKHMALEKEREKNALAPVTSEEFDELARQFKPILRNRLHYYAERMGVSYGRVTIRSQKTRWGSCSSAGNLNFNVQLMRTSRELIDYVVVHELAHRKEMNHSPAFWRIVENVLPDYKERREKLKQYALR